MRRNLIRTILLILVMIGLNFGLSTCLANTEDIYITNEKKIQYEKEVDSGTALVKAGVGESIELSQNETLFNGNQWGTLQDNQGPTFYCISRDKGLTPKDFSENEFIINGFIEIGPDGFAIKKYSANSSEWAGFNDLEGDTFENKLRKLYFILAGDVEVNGDSIGVGYRDGIKGVRQNAVWKNINDIYYTLFNYLSNGMEENRASTKEEFGEEYYSAYLEFSKKIKNFINNDEKINKRVRIWFFHNTTYLYHPENIKETDFYQDLMMVTIGTPTPPTPNNNNDKKDINIEIYKKDKNSNTPLPNVIFGLTNTKDSTNFIYKATTNESGHCKFEFKKENLNSLPLTYYLYETETSSEDYKLEEQYGYTSTNNAVYIGEINITENAVKSGTFHFKFYNSTTQGYYTSLNIYNKKAQTGVDLNLYKKDSDTMEALQGAKFGITKSKGTSTWEKTETTDSNGFCSITIDQEGTYYLYETQTSSSDYKLENQYGYDENNQSVFIGRLVVDSNNINNGNFHFDFYNGKDDNNQDLYRDGDNYNYLNLFNKKNNLGGFSIKKIGGLKGEENLGVLKRVWFAISKNSAGVTYYNRFTTCKGWGWVDSNGQISFTNWSEGEYYVWEYNQNPGYAYTNICTCIGKVKILRRK